MLERGRRGVELLLSGIRWIAPTLKEIVASIVSGVCTAIILLWIEPRITSPPPEPTPTPTPNAGPTPIPNATLTPTIEPPMPAPGSGSLPFVLPIGLTVVFLVLIVTVNRVRYVSQ